MTRNPFYKLDAEGDPVACDALEWAAWAAAHPAGRVVARTVLPAGVSVSTVFIGIDHNFCDDGDPVLWETMTFGGDYDSVCARYASRRDAIVGHELWVLVAKGEMTPFDAHKLKGGQARAAGPAAAQKKPQKKEIA